MHEPREIFGLLGISLGLGLLVGLQREWSATRTAGMRTFPLITLLGTVSALVSQSLGTWTIPAGLLAVAIMAAMGSFIKARAGDTDIGLTTEISMLVMYVVGAYLVAGQAPVAIAVGVVTAALLQFKPQLHGLASRLGERDLRAIMQFALITFVVLPILPNRTFGPYDVFNPFNTWLMVVLIVGIGLVGFVVHRFAGARAGGLLAGVIGGSISSTATTVGYARPCAAQPDRVGLSALIISIASSVVYVRVFIEVAVVSVPFLRVVALPIGLMLIASLPALVIGALRTLHSGDGKIEPANPTDLKGAMAFTAAYVVILFAMAAAKEQVAGPGGNYAVAALSGLTDIDAITLSTSQLVKDGRLRDLTGWSSLAIALVSNMLFKLTLAGVLGGWRLARQLALYFSLPILLGVVQVIVVLLLLHK